MGVASSNPANGWFGRRHVLCRVRSVREPTGPTAEVGPTVVRVPSLVLINGAPGAGKSTLARLLAQDRRMALPIDVDVLKHSLTGWDADPTGSGLHARRLCLALAEVQLTAGFDVVVGQYLARPAFIDDLAGTARAHGARFHELVLDLDVATLAERLAMRAAAPDRPEHAVNNQLVTAADASSLVESLEPLRGLRPTSVWIDARGGPGETLVRLRTALGSW